MFNAFHRRDDAGGDCAASIDDQTIRRRGLRKRRLAFDADELAVLRRNNEVRGMRPAAQIRLKPTKPDQKFVR